MSKMHNGATKLIFERAGYLRINATKAEQLLWDYLKSKPLGCKFRRQHPYGTFIFDFYCHSLKMVIEVDGSIHDLPAVKRNDAFRQKMIEQDKITVLRITNQSVEKDMKEVIRHIEECIQKHKSSKEQK